MKGKTRWMLSVLICMLAAAGIAGCGGNKSAAKPSLTMIVSVGGSGETFKVAAKDFTEKTGIPVQVVDYQYAQVREKQLLELGSNTGALDIIMVDGQIWLTELEEYLEPMDENSGQFANLVPSMVELFRSKQDGKLYASPVRIGGWVIMYRKDLFDAAGLQPPQTWDEFLHAAQTLTKDGMYGFAPAFKQGNYLTVQWAPFLYSFGGDILDETQTKAAFNTPEGVKATQFMVDLLRTHKVVSPGALSLEQNGIVSVIQQEQAAMALTYSPNFLPMNDPEKSKVTGKMAVSPFIPYDPASGLGKGISEVSGWGFGIAKMSKNQEAARQFIDFVTSPEEQLKLALHNANAPTDKSVYENEEYLQMYPSAQEVIAALDNAKVRPGVKVWTSIEDLLAAELSAAINGNKSVEQMLSDAEKAVNDLLAQQ